MAGRIEASLAAGGFKVTRDSVAGRQAAIGRSPRLRLGGRRHLFVLVAVFKAGMAGREHLDRLLDEAGQYAATVKGGVGSGAGVVAVAVVELAEAGAAEWAAVPPQKGRWPRYPVLVDLAGGLIACPDEPEDLRRLAREHVEPSMRLV